ncbi:MAG: ribosome silencing factor [Gammaproteobacteria bacterium]|nr:ribosome silencing factor [Gammaproteobacteria bacterium]
MKAQDTIVLDVKKLSFLFEHLIITSGYSTQHTQAMAEKVIESLAREGLKPFGVEGKNPGNWILIDYGDNVVHIMHPETRLFYQLEKLWTKGVRG